MKKHLIIYAAVIITLIAGCGNSRGKVKPNPDRENFIQCTICNGYGKIQVQKAVKEKQKPDIDEGSDCYNALACTSFFFGLWWEISHRDDMEYKNSETDRQIYETENSVYNSQVHDTINPPIYQSHRSGKLKTIKCHRCNGAGWINRFEYTIEPVYNKNDLDEIIKANEELNRKN